MVVVRWLTWSTVAALATVTACGCAGPESPGEPVPSTTTVITEETFPSPPPEPTVTDSTAAPGGDETPRLALPRLPIGGVAVPDPDIRHQCVEVSWIATVNGEQTFPSGYAVEITRAWFSAEGFEVVRSGCGEGSPNCLGHIIRTESPSCSLAVRALPGADPSSSVSVGLKGIVYCPRSVGRARCERFVESLGSQPQHSITLLSQPDQPGPTEATTVPGSGTDTDPSVEADPGATATPSGG